MGARSMAHASLEFRNQLRDGVAPIEACAFNTTRHEILAVDSTALRVWGLRREAKAIRAPEERSKAIAAFWVGEDDTYIVVYGGHTVNTARKGETSSGSRAPACFIYDARLRLLCRFFPCDCQVFSSVFYPPTGALLLSSKDGILRVFRVVSRKLPPTPLPRVTTASKSIQVTATEIRCLDGPTELLPMKLLDVDIGSGLVVGMNRADAFVWQLPSPDRRKRAVAVDTNVAVSTPTTPGATEAGGVLHEERDTPYTYLGGMPDLQSSEVTALSVQAPLLATGLANGKIFLWRFRAEAGNLRPNALCVVDAHGGMPVLSLHMLRIGPPNDIGPSGLSLPSNDSVSFDWSIISGGDDGGLEHWAVVGSVDMDDDTQHGHGVLLDKIGAYVAGRKTAIVGNAKSGTLQRRLDISDAGTSGIAHIMVVHLAEAARQVLEHAAATFLAGTRDASIESFKSLAQKPFSSPFGGHTNASVRSANAMSGGEGGTEMTICVAISGGLLSVLNVVEPLVHVGWTASKGSEGRREILMLSRAPISRGARAGAIGDCQDDVTVRKARASVDENQNATTDEPRGSSASECHMSHARTEPEGARTTGFLAMCTGGWLGWYEYIFGVAKLVAFGERGLPPSASTAATAPAEPTCFTACLAAWPRCEHFKTSERVGVRHHDASDTSSRLAHSAAVPRNILVAGLSDGCLAVVSMRPPGQADGSEAGGTPRSAARLIRRAPAPGASTTEAKMTALCSLHASLGLLIVSGDSDGRLGLWSTSVVASTKSPLLWEDCAAHRGPVVAIMSVQEPPKAHATIETARPAGAVSSSPSRRPREWIVSAGSGGEIRVWNTPTRWAGTPSGARPGPGLEFCATLLTGMFITSFSCVLLEPHKSSGARGRGDDQRDQGREGGGAGRDEPRGKCRRHEPWKESTAGLRLYCFVGSGDGFVQAWEISPLGEGGIGGQPLWSQKMHRHAVTSMDALGLGALGFPLPEHATCTSAARPTQRAAKALAAPTTSSTEAASECLVVCGARDHTIGIYRASYGGTFCLVRKLKVANTPAGLRSVLLAELPRQEESDRSRNTREISILVAAGSGGEIMRLGFTYRHVIERRSPVLREDADVVPGRQNEGARRDVQGSARSLTAMSSGRSILETLPRACATDNTRGNRRQEVYMKYHRICARTSQARSATAAALVSATAAAGCVVDDNDMMGRWEAASNDDHACDVAVAPRPHSATHSAASASAGTVASDVGYYDAVVPAVPTRTRDEARGHPASPRQEQSTKDETSGTAAKVQCPKESARGDVPVDTSSRRCRSRSRKGGNDALDSSSTGRKQNKGTSKEAGGRKRFRVQDEEFVRATSKFVRSDAMSGRSSTCASTTPKNKRIKGADEHTARSVVPGKRTALRVLNIAQDDERCPRRRMREEGDSASGAAGMAVAKGGQPGGGSEDAVDEDAQVNGVSAVTPQDLMGNDRLREIFTARGRHKKTPTLMREVKAIVKAWSPGLVEACSRDDLADAMASSQGGDTVTFERLCEITARILSSSNGKHSRILAKSVGVCGRTGESDSSRLVDKHKLTRSQSARLPQYEDMVSAKRRLEHNSMGEGVVVTTTVESIDAYAARSRQCRRPRGNQRRAHRGDSPDLTSNGAVIRAPRMERSPAEGTMLAPSSHVCGNESEARATSMKGLSVSKSLGFGFPDFSSVHSRVTGTIALSDGTGSAPRPSRATAACLGDVPVGLRNVWSRQGSCFFSGWADSPTRFTADSTSEETSGSSEIYGVSECVRVVRALFDSRSAAASAARIACRRLGRCHPGAHSLVIGDSDHSHLGAHAHTRSGTADINSMDTTRTTSTTSTTNKCVARTNSDSDNENFSVMTSTGGHERGGAVDTCRGHEQPSGPMENDPCSRSCPVLGLEPLGVMLYRQCHQRYGLQQTAEEKVAGLVGSVHEHAPSAAVLRLFARILGAPAPPPLNGRWPCQTPSEDAGLGLGDQLIDLVFSAREWLTVRGFMSVDGPWVGSSTRYGQVTNNSVKWRRAVLDRNHAAMCVAALLKPGWGAGHRIMDMAEQAILGLSTICVANGWTGPRGMQTWCEAIDGEEFLEALLVVVLRAREESARVKDALFGAKAVEGHSFLLARARNINAEAHAPMCPDNGVQGLLEKLPGMLPCSPSACAPQAGASEIPGALLRAHGQSGAAGEYVASPDGGAGAGALRGAQATRRQAAGEILGHDGGALRQLKPLLDAFIRHDPHRTGALPAAVFRMALCEEHGGMWGNMGAKPRDRPGSWSPYVDRSLQGRAYMVNDFASGLLGAECTDPHLTSAENAAARAIVRRYTDALDGQVCYLDVWITMYHALFRTGRITAFVDLPKLCETQLRGADAEHWEALLAYLACGGLSGAGCDPSQEHGDNLVDGGPQGAPSMAAEEKRLSQKPTRVAPGARVNSIPPATTYAPNLSRWKSAPSLGLLRTTHEGGASGLYNAMPSTVSDARCVMDATNSRAACVSANWPKLGWGPGSLTVTRPATTNGPPGVAIPAEAVLAAIHTADRMDHKSALLGLVHSTSGGAECVVADSSTLPRDGDQREIAGGVISPNLPLREANGRLQYPEAEEKHRLQTASKDGDGRGGSADAGTRQVRCTNESAESREADRRWCADSVQSGDVETSGVKDGGRANGACVAADATRRQCVTRSEGPEEDSLPCSDDMPSSAGGMLLMNLDCGTVEPPSPEPPWLDWPHWARTESDNGCGKDGNDARTCSRRKREKRTMTSVYVRCPFLDPVRSKHMYRVPRGGQAIFRRAPEIHEASASNSMAAKLYSSIAGSKPGRTVAGARVDAGGRCLDDRRDGRGGLGACGRDAATRAPGNDEGDSRIVMPFLISAQEFVLQDGQASRDERCRAHDGHSKPGPGGGGGLGSEEASIAAADGRKPWTGQRQKVKSIEVDSLREAFDEENLMLEGANTGESALIPPGLRGASRPGIAIAGSPLQSRPLSPAERRQRSRVVPSSAPSGGRGRTADGGRDRSRRARSMEQGLTAARKAGSRREISSSAGPRVGSPLSAVEHESLTRARTRTGQDRRRGRPRRSGSRTWDSDDDGDEVGRGRADAKKAAQQKMIEDMLAKEAATRRDSRDEMRRLIAEEDERKRLRREEEEAARLAQESARREAEERQKKEFEERRKALAKKRAELEERNRQLEAQRMQREAEQERAEKARREEVERRRLEEASRRTEEDRIKREDVARLAREEEARLQAAKEERAKAEEEALRRALQDSERAKEAEERHRMARHDEDIGLIIEANLAALREAARVAKAISAARRAEELKAAAREAKRRQACFLMWRADEESAIWRKLFQEEEEQKKIVEAEVVEAPPKEQEKNCLRVTRDRHGNPIDIELWSMECTAVTDSEGRLVQREMFGLSDGYTFDPKTIFLGAGGGIGGRGGGLGDGTTRSEPPTGEIVATGGAATPLEGPESDDPALDAEGLLDRERRWMEGIFAASRPEDLSWLFQDAGGAGRFDHAKFFPMVLNERVAWSEYMETARAALFKQTKAVVSKYGAAAASVAADAKPSSAGPASDSVASRTVPSTAHARVGDDGSDPTPIVHAVKLVGFVGAGDVPHSQSKQGHLDDCRQDARSASTGLGGKNCGKITSAMMPVAERATAGNETATLPVADIEIGRTYQGKTGADCDAWTLYRFSLPSPGPVITVVLDAEDGKPTLFVAKGRAPSTAHGAHWGNTAVEGPLRVAKMFPNDPSYGSGEYFIGVRSMGMPSRFVLRVSTAEPEDEISTHMRVATAIVDHLAIMSKMDAQRLVKDFVGARLEAEESLRKEQAMTASKGGFRSVSHVASGESAGNQVRQGSLMRSIPVKADKSRALTTEDLKAASSGEAGPIGGASLEGVDTSGRPTISNLDDIGPGKHSCPDEDLPILPALRSGEHALGSPAAVLHEGVARIRPSGLLATTVLSTASVSYQRVTNSRMLGTSLEDVPADCAVLRDHHDRRRGHRRRRLSAPSQVIAAEGTEQVPTLHGKDSRPCTAPSCEHVTDDHPAGRRPSNDAFAPALARYSVRCLPRTLSEELRLGDLRAKQATPLVSESPSQPQSSLRRAEERVRVDAGAHDGEAHEFQQSVTGSPPRTAAREGDRASVSPGPQRIGIVTPSCSPPLCQPQQQQQQRRRRRRRRRHLGHDVDGHGRSHDAGLPPTGASLLDLSNGRGNVHTASLSTSPQAGSMMSLGQFSSAGSPLILSRPSTRSSSGSRGVKSRALAAARAERDAVEAQARQALVRAEPNLFPEICVRPSRDRGAAAEARGVVGWLASS